MNTAITEGTGVTITGGKFAGQIGVVDTVPRGEWARVLLVGQTWPVEVRIAHLITR